MTEHQPEPQATNPEEEPPSPTNAFSWLAMLLGALAVVVLPPILGPVGLVLGGIAAFRDEPKAKLALVVAAVGTVVGLIIGMIVGTSASA